MIYYFPMSSAKWRINMSENGKKQPVLEIKPSEEYHERPMWQRVAAFILIAVIVAATVACAFWPYL
jgi:hypothetical protein